MHIENFDLKINQELLLDNASMSFETKKLNLIIGRNGVGKTLLLDLISDLDHNRPKNFHGFPESSRIIYHSQGLPFIAEATVKDTIALIGDLSKDSAVTMDYLPQKIRNNLDKPFGALSMGERRYLTIWLFLQIERDLYIFDEPFANLDLGVISDILNLFYDKLNQGKQMILTSHQFDFLIPEKTHIIFIEERQVRFNDSLTAFLDHYQSFGQAFDI
ncbi:ATP-binding cassette domain-containing protein [Streptococcus ratti]|uniref:ATP-binding protein n=1 Tax=Streptococcus ratti FA-1 = DSM 20564 TaxID=699248 RepID=A0ABP2QWY0_STRRT|nr:MULTISPECIES: ABC transporter ATP-binding protein [Streptococcus]EJN93540.1 putative ATP-binding protein [Streptococcus ratti FA-1 = DSM 20564]EMP71842.1 ATP-binding protein [Streptococcus ratti FA-1 = DSM 20564]QEY07412.1 AAA family ATPase [Streptococcus ratti]VEI59861.1 ATP-binding protein [Streptococcus mutans]